MAQFLQELANIWLYASKSNIKFNSLVKFEA